MKSFSNLGGNPLSLALLVLLVLVMTPSGAAAPRKDRLLRKLEETSNLGGGNLGGGNLGGGGGMLGGFSGTSVDDPVVVDAADFAFDTLQANATYGLSADVTSYEVTSASTQVVSGTNIEMEISFLDSSGACVSTATVVVYDDFIGGTMSLTSYEPTDGCASSTLPDIGGGMLGGSSETSVDNAEVVAAASFAFDTLQSNATYGLSADATSYEVTSASTQVVAGLNIQMDISFLDSSGDCVSTATVVVYADPAGTMSLTSYEPTDGCPAPLQGEDDTDSSGYCPPKGSTLFFIQMMSMMILFK